MTSRRLLKETHFRFSGEHFEIETSTDISTRINLKNCVNNLLSKYGLTSQDELNFQYINYFSSIAEDSSVPSQYWLTTKENPLIIVGIYSKSTLLDANTACGDMSFNSTFELKTEISTDKLEDLKDMKVDPFDDKDTFFTDVCSLGELRKDLTLNQRKTLYYYDPKKHCNQLENQICKVDSFDSEGKIVCNCSSSEHFLLEMSKGFWIAFKESNARLAKCYNKVFHFEVYKNIGFQLSFGIIVFFYFLFLFSTKFVIWDLQGDNYYAYLYNSATFCVFREKSYFEFMDKLQRSKYLLIKINVHEEVPLPSSNKREDTPFAGIEQIIEETGKLPRMLDHLDENGLLELTKVAPTRSDFNSVSLKNKHFDKRGFFKVFKYFCNKYHVYINCFMHKNLIVPLHVRLFILMTTILSQFTFNAFFYTENMIDERAKSEENVEF